MDVHPEAFIHERAVLIGDVRIGQHSSIWPNAVIRADWNKIVIGQYCSIQDNTVLHASNDFYVEIGDFVTVGHSCVLHGCRVGNKVIIGIHSTILDGVEIGDNTIIGANTLLTEKMVIPQNSFVIGIPGEVSKRINPSKMFITYGKIYDKLARQYKCSHRR